MDSLYLDTCKAAKRILKSHMREHLFATKIAEGGAEADQVWSPLLLVQSSFAKPAYEEWREVLTRWQDPMAPLVRSKLEALLKSLVREAAQDVLQNFDSPQAESLQAALAEFERSFSPITLLGASC